MTTRSKSAGNALDVVSNIQILRCFAAMAVVWHHLETRLNADLGGPHWGFTGMSGVDVFFVISGFIMFHTTQGRDKSVSRFWTDRAIRIAPLYWLAMLAIIGMYLAGMQPDGVKALDPGDMLAGFTFFPDVRADGIPYPVLDVGWTLVFEAYFYVLFGLTFFIRSQAKALALLSALFVGVAVVRMLTPGLPFALEYWFRPITLEFAAGGLLAILYRSPRLKALPAPLLKHTAQALLAIGIGALLVAGWRVGWRLNQDYELRVLAFGVPAFLVVAGALLLERAGVVWKSKTLLLLGAASYSIYISHQFVIEGLERFVAMIDPTINLEQDLLAIAVGLVAAVGAGVLVHVAVEKPLTRRLKRLFRPRPASPPAVPDLSAR